MVELDDYPMIPLPLRELLSHPQAPRVISIAAGVVGGAAATYLSYQLLKKVFGKEEWEKVGVVSSLHIYPIKSCKGISVDQIQLDKFGAVNDRRFMLQDMETQRFITQRQDPAMCKIKATVMKGGSIQLSAPGMDDYVFKPKLQPLPDTELVGVCVWDDFVEGVDQGAGVAAWLSLYLGGREVRLLGMGPTFDRPTDAKYTPRQAQAQAAFSDGFPLLLISNASLSDLNSKLAAASPPSPPLPMDRFRPNIVVDGVTCPFAEDTWRRIRIASQEMAVVKPCSRCKVPTTDQETGERSEENEPTKTLSTYRSKAHVKAKCGDKVDVFFGQNVCHLSAEGSIKVNDEVWALRIRYPWSS